MMSKTSNTRNSTSLLTKAEEGPKLHNQSVAQSKGENNKNLSM